MELSPSKASSRTLSTPLTSTSLNNFSKHSFAAFLDTITPAEFSELLRARVRHLLSTWPPTTDTTKPSVEATTSFHPEQSPFPSLESIQAFATFFRSQDSPLPSPIDLSTPTSLATLRHHLLALQTLLSFLSGQELKEIVRARMEEGGKNMSVAVQGLMEVMQNPRESEIEDSMNGEDAEALDSGENTQSDEDDSPAEVGTIIPAAGSTAPPVPLDMAARRLTNISSSSIDDGQPPRKRQKFDSNEALDKTSKKDLDKLNLLASSVALQPRLYVPSPVVFPRPEPALISDATNPGPLSTRVQEPSVDFQKSDNSIETSRDAPLSRTDSIFKSEEEVSKTSLGHPNRTVQGGRDNVKGIKVANPAHVEVPGEIKSLAVTEVDDEWQTSRLQDKYPNIGHIQRRFSPDKGKQLFIEQAEGESNSVASEEEQRLHATFGIPPRNSQETHSDIDLGEPFECIEDTVEEAQVLSISVSDAFRRSESRASRFRSRSPSSERSMSDCPSPPGPILRSTVDWDSGVSPAVESEGTHIFGSEGAIFHNEQRGVAIPPHLFAPIQYMPKPSGGWNNADNPPKVSEPEKSSEGSVGQRPKLFIRLPPRPRPKLKGPGVPSEGSVASQSASARPSPTPQRKIKKSPKLTSASELHPTGASSATTKSAVDANRPPSTSVSSANITPSATSMPHIAAPHASPYPPGSRPQSGSPGTMAYAMPPHGYPPQHPFPGPWFGAMFYVPLRGHPAHGMQPMRMPPGPSRPMPGQDAGPSSSAAGARKKGMKRTAQGSPQPQEPDPNATYTDDVGVKESSTVKRRCHNCQGIYAPSWRKSKLTVGKILCNKCGIYESTHMIARPLKTRPRRFQASEGGPKKKRKKVLKTLAPAP